MDESSIFAFSAASRTRCMATGSRDRSILFSLLELGDEVIDDALVKIVAAEVIVARRGQHLDDAGGDIENGHVERAAAEVVDHDLLRLLFVDAVGEGRGRRLVDDALDVQPRNLARVLRRLPLCVGKIGRDGDDGVGDGLAEDSSRHPL